MNNISHNPLLEIGEYKFQDLCREILEREGNLISCKDYEERGVEQFGADLIADHEDLSSTIIGQCKCYKKFQPSDFKKTTTDFLEHLNTHWKPYDIKRFILFLACDVVKTNQHSAIQVEKKRFFEHGITYEVWGKKKILSKLRPYPQIVQNYFVDAPDYWLESICKISKGSISTQAPQITSTPNLNISFAQIGKLSEIFSATQREKLEHIKELQKEGRLREAGKLLSKIRNSVDEW